ncbi:MAG TPA: TolC family protein [Helicobacteraceae bacterium]|nr:TolC family protein [Helicobacteraceae bacterium]
MKVLSALTTLSLLYSLSFSNEVQLDNNSTTNTQVSSGLEQYLSALKRKQIELDFAKVDNENSKLRDSWIQPIQIQYTLSRQNIFNELDAPETESQNAAIVINQPIFQFGGIYYGIKFASANRKYSNYTVQQQKRALIKQAVELLMQIKQADMSIAKQQLQIANSQINLEQKQEQFLNGQLDSGFLNNAVIERNVAKQTLFDLETAKERLVSKFKTISDLDYVAAEIPYLALLGEEEFLQNNIDMKLIESETEKNRYNENVTIAKYLPSVNLQGSYNWQKNESVFFINGAPQNASSPETSYYRYGVQATLPLDINAFNDYEVSRIAYLKSKIQITDKQRELKALFEQVSQNLENFDKKIALSKENQQLYNALFMETTQLYKAGYKTKYDVDTLDNSQQIEVVNQKIYEIDKQLELLSLYEKLSRDDI